MLCYDLHRMILQSRELKQGRGVKQRLALTCNAAEQAALVGLPQRRLLKRSAGSLNAWSCLLERSPGWGTLHMHLQA